MKKKNKQYILIGLIVLIAFIDGFSNLLSNVPIIGGLITSVSNVLWEIVELGLVFGLISLRK